MSKHHSSHEEGGRRAREDRLVRPGVEMTARRQRPPLLLHLLSCSTLLCFCMHACPCSVGSGRSSAAHVRDRLTSGIGSSSGLWKER